MSNHVKSILVLCLIWLLCVNSYSLATPNEELLIGSKRGIVSDVKNSLANNADPNTRDENGVTPLMLSSFHGRTEIVKILMNSGADVNLSCNKMNIEIGDYIRYHDTALGIAVRKRYKDVVNILIPKADLNAQNSVGQSSLMIASSNGDIDNAKALLKAGANVNMRGGVHDNTALHEAVKSGYYELVELLINSNAEIDVRNKINKTALMIAEENGFTKIAVLLKKSGAKISVHPAVKISLAIGLFLIVFGVSIRPLTKMFPLQKETLALKILSCSTSLALSSMFAMMVLQSSDTIQNMSLQIFEGYSNLVNTFISILFLSIGIYLFWSKIKAYF